MKILDEFFKGFIKENPIFRIMLGLCPTLAVSTSVVNAIGMGAAVTFVLIGSNAIISSLRKFIPDEIRLPAYIVIIATFVTVVELMMKGFAPALSEALGIFIPLIVVNCIILGRAEAFASKNPVILSIFDGLGMGIGFTLSLLCVASIREVIGAGTFFGFIISKSYQPILIFTMAPGALLVLSLLMGCYNIVFKKVEN